MSVPIIVLCNSSEPVKTPARLILNILAFLPQFMTQVLLNPSFELTGGGVGGGMPDGFYGTVKGDAAAAAFSDSRDSVHGLHSLRIHTPSAGNGQLFSHFMCPASLMRPDTEYELAVWARGKSFAVRTDANTEEDSPVLLLGFQEPAGQMRNVTLTEEWTRYTVHIKSPPQGDEKWSCYVGTPKVAWELVTPGVAFLDLLELVPLADGSADDTDDDTPARSAVARELPASGPHEMSDATPSLYAGTKSDRPAPVQDTLALPLSPMGFFSHELDDPNESVPISTQRAGMTSGYIYLPHGDHNISEVNAWLDRCDAVGTSVLLDVRFDASESSMFRTVSLVVGVVAERFNSLSRDHCFGCSNIRRPWRTEAKRSSGQGSTRRHQSQGRVPDAPRLSVRVVYR